MRNDVYEKLREYEKKTGRNLPYMIVDDKENRSGLIAELLKILDTDPRSAAHLLLEQMVMVHRIADNIYIETPDWDVDNTDELVDKMAALADDYMITAGYLLDMA